jgi:hypothetical protein
MISEIVRPFGSGYRAAILVGFHHAAECLRLGGAVLPEKIFARTHWYGETPSSRGATASKLVTRIVN